MALNLAGILGGIATEVISGVLGGNGDDVKRPTVTRIAAVPGGGLVTADALGVLNLIMDGASDAMVRSAASRARVSKRMLFDTLQGLDLIAVGGRAFTPMEKIAISDQIERIFKPRRRPAISKQFRRLIKQVQFLRKELRPLFK